MGEYPGDVGEYDGLAGDILGDVGIKAGLAGL